MNSFTPWTVFIDVGLISCLLLLGKLLRAKVKMIQSLFIPSSLLAGIIGLILGPNCLKVFPLSADMGTYASILIAFVFSCFPFSSSRAGKSFKSVSQMWRYSQAGMLLQWGFGGLLGIVFLCRVWHLNDAFGISMPSGYCGGHGTAAAIGTSFAQLGYGDMFSLAMTAATIGILAAVILGIMFVKYGTRKGYTSYLADFKSLPPELRTGLLYEKNYESIGTATVSSISIDPLAFNFALICITALGGYGISKLIGFYFPQLMLPVFSCAFVFAIFVKWILVKSKVDKLFCPKTIGHLNGVFTDYLVAFGIASVKISLIIKYIIPLSILLIVGLIVTAFYVFYFSKKIFKEDWFEKSLFTWGWYTGTVAMGIALLRIVDSKHQSTCMDDYAIAYLAIAPVEICLITFAPIAFVNGYGLVFSALCFLLGLVLLISVRNTKKKGKSIASLR